MAQELYQKRSSSVSGDQIGHRLAQEVPDSQALLYDSPEHRANLAQDLSEIENAMRWETLLLEWKQHVKMCAVRNPLESTTKIEIDEATNLPKPRDWDVLPPVMALPFATYHIRDDNERRLLEHKLELAQLKEIRSWSKKEQDLVYERLERTVRRCDPATQLAEDKLLNPKQYEQCQTVYQSGTKKGQVCNRLYCKKHTMNHKQTTKKRKRD